MSGPATPLVVGIGNVLLRDEGVGVAVVRELERRAAEGRLDLPPGTRLVDGGTLGLDLLPLLSSASMLVLVDAVDLGRPPGTVCVIRDAAIEGTLAGHVSPHQVGVADLVAAARLIGVFPAAASLVGIQPALIEIGLELSDEVEAAVGEAMERVCAELHRGPDAAAAAA